MAPESVVRGDAEVSSATVRFVGAVFGETKDALLRAASAYLLPSYSEGLPMSVLEAWAYRLPVLMTDYCNLPEGFEAGAAIRIETEAASIREGYETLFSASEQEREAWAENGRALVEQRFTWPRIAKDMRRCHEWMLGGGDAPEFVEEVPSER